LQAILNGSEIKYYVASEGQIKQAMLKARDLEEG